MFIFCIEGKKTSIHTKISQGEKVIHAQLIGMMSRQMRLSKGDFDHFVDCTLTGDGYRAKMIESGHVIP